MAGQGTSCSIMGEHRAAPPPDTPYAAPQREEPAAARISMQKQNRSEVSDAQPAILQHKDGEFLVKPSTSLPPASSSSSEKDSESSTLHNGDLLAPSSPISTTEEQSNSGKPQRINMLVPPCLQLEPVTQHLLATTTLCPPVTKDTLSELDLSWIMNNISLRCDVNYDHDLHFMPITGKRGDEKRKNAHKYWLALAAELRIYLHNVRHCQQCNMVGFDDQLAFPQRLPEMFENLRILLETLVPDRDHDQVAENVDVDFLMQQVQHGVFDAARMSSWLAKLLKTHCAPMRDEWADAISRKIEEGASDASMITLVAGLEKLFSFLEAMKLDVANHQIRTLRYFLIEDTVTFQKQYFQRRIESGKISVETSQTWYEIMADEYDQNCTVDEHKPTAEFAALASLLHGLTMLCKSDNGINEVPLTLHYDRNRIQQLQEDVQDSVFLSITLASFDKLTRRLVGRSSPAAHAQLQNRLLAMTDGEPGKSVSDIWHGQVDHIALEVTRLAYQVCRDSAHLIAEDEFSNTARHIRRDFADMYDSLEADLLAKLEQMTCEQAISFQHLSALELSEAQREWQQGRQLKGQLRQSPDIEDMARRLAHMGVLHWQIWSDLAYLDFDGEMAEGEEGELWDADWSQTRMGGEWNHDTTYEIDDSGGVSPGEAFQ